MRSTSHFVLNSQGHHGTCMARSHCWFAFFSSFSPFKPICCWEKGRHCHGGGGGGAWMDAVCDAGQWKQVGQMGEFKKMSCDLEFYFMLGRDGHSTSNLSMPQISGKKIGRSEQNLEWKEIFCFPSSSICHTQFTGMKFHLYWFITNSNSLHWIDLCNIEGPPVDTPPSQSRFFSDLPIFWVRTLTHAQIWWRATISAQPEKVKSDHFHAIKRSLHYSLTHPVLLLLHTTCTIFSCCCCHPVKTDNWGWKGCHFIASKTSHYPNQKRILSPTYPTYHAVTV